MAEPNDRDRLTGLVQFAAELLRGRDKTVMALRDYGLGVFHEKDLAPLPGFVRGEGESWLKVERLRPGAAPACPSEFDGWIEGDMNHPAHPPELLAERALLVTLEEASDLAEAGFVAEPDVSAYRPLDDALDQGDEAPVSGAHVHVILRTSRMAEWRAAFEQWLTLVWRPWAEVEGPRRRTMEVYEILYRLHSMIQAGNDRDVPEIVWGIGVARWNWEGAKALDMPIIEKPCELLLESDGALVITPRLLPPAINLKPFRAIGLDEADRAQQALATRLDARASDVTLPLSPFDALSFDDILTDAVTQLSSTATYVAGKDIEPGARLPAPGPELVVYGSWVVFARPRSLDWRQQDLRRIQDEIRNCPQEALQKPLLGIVKAPSDEKSQDAFDGDWSFTRPDFGSRENSRFDTASGREISDRGHEIPPRKATRYFFPLPFNDEQARIVDMLEEQDIAVVTGPPGTGKTHTIANIIAHYMANGKRVLVTARTPEAIAVVQDKLPANLRSMTIAVVHSDRQGARQLEAAVQALANEAASARVEDLKARIVDLQDEIDRLDEEIARMDGDLAAIARANLQTIPYRGRERLPMELAEVLTREQATYQWFDDRPRPESQRPSRLELVAQIVALRERLKEDVIYLGANIPSPDDLPSTNDLIAALRHEEGRRERVAEDFSDAPVMALDTQRDEAQAREIHALMLGVADRLGAMGPVSTSLFASLAAELLANAKAGVREILERTAALLRGFDEAAPCPVAIPESHRDDEGFLIALARLARGERPLGLAAALFARDLKAALGEVRYDGRAPASAQEWARVHAYRNWLVERDRIFALWMANPALPSLADGAEAFVSRLRGEGEDVADLISSVDEAFGARARLWRFFPHGLEIDEALRKADLEPILFAFRANLEYESDRRHGALERLRAFAASGRGALFRSFGDLADALEAGASNMRDLVDARSALTREIVRLGEKQADLARLSELLSFLARLGAPEWSNRLSNPIAPTSALVPDDWQEAWDWAVARNQIDAIVGLENSSALITAKAQAVKRRSDRLERLIRERTLLGLKGHLTDKIRQALTLFTTAIRNLGSGTGQNAGRWLRQIRESALAAAPAAPVWIMPEHRVAEQLPADLGAFDLVVLDEASQSDITAIGALARGKQWLIVGDEQQVSPTAIGVPQAHVDGLRAQWLRHLPIRNAIDQDTSIFDIASMMYPGAQLMLREHFRSVAPIIQFSTRFYNGRLIPLRIPKASERLDPPLIDVFVADGQYVSRWNRQERDFIVEEVARIVNDPAMVRRTLAVISLVGAVQAEHIERALVSDPRIGHDAMERHRIVCGDSRTLQGQERDIVLLSMVQAGNASRALTTRTIAQRFNVAMSRARDRLYLVRSLAASHLRSDDLKRQVIDHFADPMPEGRPMACATILDRCDSNFERVVCARLLDAGYRVRPQVKAGPYSIDLVVEGREDRRLAIELDGDKYHGPDRWDDDMRRQAALERAGWVFWRVFGSQWSTEPDFWWNDLVQTLTRLGIEPIGADAGAETYTEHRRVEGGRLVGVSGQPLDAADAMSPPEAPIPSEASDPASPRLSGAPVLTKSASEPDALRGLYHDDDVVAAGSSVQVRHAGEDRSRTLLISASRHAPDEGVIHVSKPLAQALLGAGVDEEVDYLDDGARKAIFIEAIFNEDAVAAAQ